MIQLNLLPDVKTKFIKARRTKRLVLLSSITVSCIAIGVVAILGSIVYGAQRVQLRHYDDLITKNTSEINKIEGLNKILTVQNQLNSVGKLHNEKPVTSRLFVFLPQITPSNVQISSLKLNYDDSTMGISGTAASLEDINKFVDTLKFTKYTTDTNQSPTVAFTSVVLGSFSQSDGKKAGYSVAFKFDPAIFNSSNKSVFLAVPKITSTRSQTESPDALFKTPGK
jgi:hypothetical protein